MTTTSNLRPASAEELAHSLSFALCFDGRKRKYDADHMMARIVADRLVEHLRISGYVIMKATPPGPLTTPDQ